MKSYVTCNRTSYEILRDTKSYLGDLTSSVLDRAAGESDPICIPGSRLDAACIRTAASTREEPLDHRYLKVTRYQVRQFII